MAGPTTTAAAAAGGGLGSQHRRRRPKSTKAKAASAIMMDDDDDGEDVLSPLILVSTPRMSKPMLSNNKGSAASSVGPTQHHYHVSSPSISSPYSLTSPPPRIRSPRNEHREDDNNDHHFQIMHNQFEEMIRNNNGNMEDNDDNSKASSFLSKASKKLKKKLNTKQQQQGRKSWDGVGWSDHHYHNNNQTNTACYEHNTNGGDIPLHVAGKEESGRARIGSSSGSSSGVRTKKERRDPSPTHEHGDDDEYYSNYRYRFDRQNHHHHQQQQPQQQHPNRRHDHHDNFMDNNDGDADDGEYTHNDGSTLSTNSTPTLTHHTTPPRMRKHDHDCVHLKSPQAKEVVVVVAEKKEQVEEHCDNNIENFAIQSVWLRTDDDKKEEICIPTTSHHSQKQRQQQQPRQQHQQQHHQPNWSGRQQLQHLDQKSHRHRSRDLPPSSPLNVVTSSGPHENPVTQYRIPQEVLAATSSPVADMKQTDSMVLVGRETTTSHAVTVPMKTHGISKNHDDDHDEDKRGPTSFAEKKQFIMNSLNLVPSQTKLPQKQPQPQPQHMTVAKEIPSDVIVKEDLRPLISSGTASASKRSCHQNNVNRSSVMNELITKFGKMGEVQGVTDDHLNSPFQKRVQQQQQQQQQQELDIAMKVQTDVVTTVVSSPTVRDDSTMPTKPYGRHLSSTMAELVSKFGTEDGALHANNDSQGKVKNNPSHQDSPSKPSGGRDANKSNELSSTTTLSNPADANQNSDDIMRKENECLSLALQRMKEKLSNQEKETNSKVSMLEQELRMEKHELKKLREDKLQSEAKDDARLHDYIAQLSADLDSYKAECASYRERILQKEREISKTENFLYEEKKKVLSLESENQMLLNIAEDNVSHATSTDRAKETELAAYKDECDRYRNRVLELERKVLAAECALDSTGHIASALEEEKNSMSAQLLRWQSDNDTLETENEVLRSKIDEMDSTMKSLEIELSTLQSEWSAAQTNMVDAKGNADENRKSMCILESENASLMHKLEQLQTIVNRCNQVEEENISLKKLNIDLTERHVEMSKEVLDARGLASNTNRLQKIVQDNESYISKMQDELAKERTTHLESIQNTRQKYTVEITALTEKLRTAEESARIAELKNYELDEKLVSIEREHSELRELEAHQTKCQSDQMMKLMEHADDLRRKHMECQSENASLKYELSEKEHAHTIRVKEVQSELAQVERDKSKVTDSLAILNADLLQARKEKTREMEHMGRQIRAKEEALTKLEIDFANLALEKSTSVQNLGDMVQQLEQSLDDAMTRKNALEEHIYEIQKNVVDAFSSMRREKLALLSDIQNQIIGAREATMKELKESAWNFGNAVEKQILDKSMKHSVAMSIVSSEKCDLERLLWTEKEKANNLEASLVLARKDTIILADACAKLSVCEKGSLLDAIDNIILDSSNAKFQVTTLEADIADLSSKKADLEVETAELTRQLREKNNLVSHLEAEIEKGLVVLRDKTEATNSLEEKLEKQIKETECVVEQMKSSFDADRKSQDRIVDEIISAKEEAILREQALLIQVDTLAKEASVHDEQVQKLKEMLDESKQDRDEVASKYEASRQQVACLLDEMKSSQKNADELMNRSMKIEDELRQQLQSVQSEKNSLERTLKVVQRESDRLLNEFCTEKHDLTSTQASQVGVIQELEVQIDDLTRSIIEAEEKILNHSTELAGLRQYNTELIEKYEFVCSERDVLSATIANDREMHANERKDMELRLEGERLAHASAVTEVQSVFNIEMDQQAAKFTSQEEKIRALSCKATQLGEEVEKLKVSKEDQKRHISQLKLSLKEAVEEAQRLGSKVTSEQDELLKVTHTMTSFEEENSTLKQSLEQSRSDFDKIAAILALQEPEHSDLESSLQKIIREKARLENELSDKEATLFKTMNTLTHFELKLARAEQERDAQGERARSEIAQLQNELASVVSTQQLNETELKQIVALKRDWQVKEAELEHQIVELKKSRQLKETELENQFVMAKKDWQLKEAELKNHIVSLKKDYEAEYVNNQLYREQLGKMEENEAAACSLNIELQSLKEENCRLTENFAKEVRELNLANDLLKVENTSLTENLATVKSKIDCVKSKIAAGRGDDSSTTSGDSAMAIHVKKTAKELQSTVKAIKKHHDDTVRKLQGELEDARKRLKKYECKVNDLTTLIEENAVVIESLHEKLRGKTSEKSSFSSPRQSYSDESEVTE